MSQIHFIFIHAVHLVKKYTIPDYNCFIESVSYILIYIEIVFLLWHIWKSTCSDIVAGNSYKKSFQKLSLHGEVVGFGD